ncbi:cytochrome P450 [Tsuneonella sp. CC-YZS046]|uniref:cytochrome P450 n=1 Tax=Tsuneonella sp. CC-YZS046 TaxID=3042152 RepID=UPI002D785B26|nr:cytochrome P450 [Tsuneonella sp. CC-YZS046]WRO67113.1 cytochrome P450 [Tsuneonella sp. CC-YZS046]
MTKQVDPFSKEYVADAYTLLEELRTEATVAWNEQYQTWMILEDRAAREILSMHNRFVVAGTVEEEVFGSDAFICVDQRARHDAFRGVWARTFAPTAFVQLRRDVREMALNLIDQVKAEIAEKGSCDVVPVLCRRIPSMVIAQLLGIPDEMLDRILAWSDRMGEAALAAGDPNHPAFIASEKAKGEFADFLFEMIEMRRHAPGDDLISQLVISDIAKTVTIQEMMVNCRQLLFAGNETTAKWMANCLTVLGERHDIRATVLADPKLIPQTLEEIIRWDPVAQLIPRMASGEISRIGDMEISPGESVWIMIAATNRDPSRYENPHHLDIYREQKGHLGFGFALHNCLGIGLARMEAAVAIEAFLEMIGDYEIIAPTEHDMFPVRGPKVVRIAV